MKKILVLLIVVVLCLSISIYQVNAQRIIEGQGKEIKLSTEQWKKLNIFFSNFSEVFLNSFSEGKITNEELIRFGISHNNINNPKLIEKFDASRGRLAARYVEASVEKYFGIKQIYHKSIDEHEYKDGYYLIGYASGEAYCFSQVTKLIDINGSNYIAYVNVYVASSGFTGDPHGSNSIWNKDGDIPDLGYKIKAIIKKVEKENKSRYILLEYIKQK